MYFGLSEDQIFFQDNVEKFLNDYANLDVIKLIANEEGSDQKNEIHSGILNLGCNNILIPEKYGGLGLNLLFATAVSQSLGTCISPSPYTGSYVMAPIGILEGGNDIQKKTYLKKMVSGEVKIGIAFSEYISARDKAGLEFKNNMVNGKSLFVLDLDYATHIMLADKNGQIGILDIDSKGVEIIKLKTVDRTRNFMEVEFKDVKMDILEKTLNSNDSAEKAISAGRIALAADSVGASQAMIDKAVAYSKERKQFNRVIGSFQAVKHMCAEMSSELEPCYSLIWHAAHTFDGNEKNYKLMACHAKSHISEISKVISKKSTEVHGGMGFTDLLGLHYWFKRIGVNRQLLGSPEIVREEAAKIQGL